MPTIEELLHAYYAGDDAALNQLSARLRRPLGRIAVVILRSRGVARGALVEWDVHACLVRVWVGVALSRVGGRARWVHERWSALRWLIGILCEQMDWTMGFREPY